MTFFFSFSISDLVEVKSCCWINFLLAWVETETWALGWASALLNLLHCCLRESRQTSKTYFAICQTHISTNTNEFKFFKPNTFHSLIWWHVHQEHVSIRTNFTQPVGKAGNLSNIKKDHSISFHQKIPLCNPMGDFVVKIWNV